MFIDYLVLISFCFFDFSESVICLLAFELYDGASLFGIAVWLQLLRTCVGAGIIESLRIISDIGFVVLEFVIYWPTIDFWYGDSLFDYMVFLFKVRTRVGAGIYDCVSPISFRRFVLSESVRSPLKFELLPLVFLFVWCSV